VENCKLKEMGRREEVGKNFNGDLKDGDLIRKLIRDLEMVLK
jgi:hypothetical protein